MRYRLEYQENTKSAEAIFSGVNKEAALKGMRHLIQSFGIFIKDENDQIAGGITGSTYYGSLQIDMLFVDKELRSQGFGTKLVSAAEKLGRDRKCSFATLTTMSFEARPFYEKLGYSVEFIRDGYENNTTMIFLRKSLIGDQ